MVILSIAILGIIALILICSTVLYFAPKPGGDATGEEFEVIDD
jgi:hypothetical protein